MNFNIYAPNKRMLKCVRQILIELKSEIDKSNINLETLIPFFQ